MNTKCPACFRKKAVTAVYVFVVDDVEFSLPCLICSRCGVESTRGGEVLRDLKRGVTAKSASVQELQVRGLENLALKMERKAASSLRQAESAREASKRLQERLKA